MNIKQSYPKTGYYGNGTLYGPGHAKSKGIKDATFLCLPDQDIHMEPEEYRFYKIIDNKPVEVSQTRNFYTGKRYIDPKYYVAKNVK